jgi:hypothetical protein
VDFEDSEVEGEFSDESEHEEILPVGSDISSSDEEESDDNMQPVTSSWKVYCDGDGDGAVVNSYILYTLDKESGKKIADTHFLHEKSYHSVCRQCEEQKFKKEGKTIISWP